MKSKTENMFIDIDSVPEGKNPVFEIEFLRNIDSWVKFDIGFMPKEQLIRYLVVLYSYDSFLNQKTPIPLEERKARALSFSGAEKDKVIEDSLLRLNDDVVLKMVLDFLIAQNNTLWIEIVTTEQQYEEAIGLRLQPIKRDAGDAAQLTASSKKKALRVDCKEMQADIETFYKKFYLDHNDVKEKVRRRATTLELLSKNSKDV